MQRRRVQMIFRIFFALGLFASPLRASTGRIGPPELQSRLAAGGCIFLLEGRLGDGAAGEIPELRLSDSLGQTSDSASRDWISNREESFSLAFADGRLRFRLGSSALERELNSPPGALFLSCLAEADKSAATLLDLRLDGKPLGDSCWTLGPASRSILWIDTDGLSDGFELTGTADFAWIGGRPGPEALSFEIGASAGAAGEGRSWDQLKRLY